MGKTRKEGSVCHPENSLKSQGKNICNGGGKALNLLSGFTF